MWVNVTGLVCKRNFGHLAFQLGIHRYLSSTPRTMKVKVGLIQLTNTEDKSANFTKCSNLIEEAVSLGAQMVFLPECFDFIGLSRENTLDLSESIDGTLISEYRSLAAKRGVWMSLGGLHRKVLDSPDNRICNTHVLIDSTGAIQATYDKVHLFDVNIEGGPSNDDSRKRFVMSESKVVQPGSATPPVVHNTPVGSLGLAICYDMRFPELAAHLRYAGGAEVLTYPSAFSVPTGQAGHWHTLLRARAIDNQCYVVAAAQEGQHNAKRASYGHSLVVDPWGRTIAERSQPGPGVLVCELDLPAADNSPLASFRQSLPVWQHRRGDLFPMQDSGCRQEIGQEEYVFGPKVIPPEHVFYRSELSYAFVNISPLVPGHVLVSPVTCAARFDELSRGQVADLYLTVKQITAPLCAHFSATSLTVSIQDGRDAGQSVPHVHVHVLPRKPNDFTRNDDIYGKLQEHDKFDNRVFRTSDVMKAEAAELRKLFY